MLYLALAAVAIALAAAVAAGAWLRFARRAAVAPAPGAPRVSAMEAAARAFRSYEDKPCITPIDCVASKHCAGHCGYR